MTPEYVGKFATGKLHPHRISLFNSAFLLGKDLCLGLDVLPHKSCNGTVAVFVYHLERDAHNTCTYIE